MYTLLPPDVRQAPHLPDVVEGVGEPFRRCGRRDRMAADHLRESLTHARWDETTKIMLYGVHYGYSAAEMLWARDGRHVAIDAIRVRNRLRFVFGPAFELRLLRTEEARFDRADGGAASPAGRQTAPSRVSRARLSRRASRRPPSGRSRW